MVLSHGRAIALRAWRVALPLALGTSALALSTVTARLEGFSRSPFPLSPTVPYHRTLALHSPSGLPHLAEPAAASPAEFPADLKIRRGETLGSILQDLGLDATSTQQATTAIQELIDVRRLRAGCSYSATYDEDGGLATFRLALASEGRLTLARAAGGGAVSDDVDGVDWNASLQPYERRTEVRAIRGELDGMLESAVRTAGGDPTLAYRLADVLEYDLDFTRDLRRGDRFEILYEQELVEGRPSAAVGILAAVYENGGRRIEAYRYDDGGYYDGEGRPLRKMFLRSPLPYSRITSRFSHRRYHPVLKTHRPHWGVDYGAPTGTPVRVTANGVVQSAGWDRGGGKTVSVRHPQDYVTSYLHLSRYAAGLSSGDRVKQGDIIGYVGATGLATGPHLDYRVKHRGTWIDPLGLGRQSAEPIPKAELTQFYAWRDSLREGLGAGSSPAPAPAPAELPTAAAVRLAQVAQAAHAAALASAAPAR